MTAPRRLQLRRGNTAAVSAYVGAPGELIVNTDTNTLYLHDGSTVGGVLTTVNVSTITTSIVALTANAAAQAGSIATLTSNAAVQAGNIAVIFANLGAVSGSIATLTSNAAVQSGLIASLEANAAIQAGLIASSTGTYGNANVKTYLSNFNGNLIPSANLTYSLGSITNQWKDLFVSNNTIYIGGVPLSIDSGGNLLVNGNVVQGATGNITLPPGGIITAPNAQEFQLQAKDANSVLRNEINLDPNNGTYMSVWSDQTTSFSSADWGSGSWNNESGLGAARFTDAQPLQDFWLTGNGSLGLAYEVSINGGARTPNVFYDGNNGETYGVLLGVDPVPPGGHGTTVPITSLVFYYRTQSKINIDVNGSEILLDAQSMDIDLRTTLNLDLRANQNLNLRGLGQYPVRIYTNGTTHKWEFDTSGSLTLPREGKIYGIGQGAASDRSGYISWAGNSSGDGSGYNTMRLVPDQQGLEAADQYIIIDPTAGQPGHIHIRAGGTQDNSGADLFLGGEHSHVKISAGLNPPVTVLANNNAWTFGTDGNLTLPSDGYLVVTSGITTNGASPAPTISGFTITNSQGISGNGNITTTQYVNAGYFTGNGALLTGIVAAGGTTYSNINVAAYLGNVSTNINPSTRLTYTLGQHNKEWSSAHIQDVYIKSTLQAGDGGIGYTGGNAGELLKSTGFGIAWQEIKTINGNSLFGNGDITISGGGSSYSNANVISMLGANSLVSIGNVNSYSTQSNITQVFIGNITAVTAGGGIAFGTSYLLNNLYFAANGSPFYRNTQTGAAQLAVSGSGGFVFAGNSSTVTANTNAGLTSWATISSSGLTMQNSLGITSVGAVAVNSSLGITTNQGTFLLANATATTINMGGAATTINLGTTASATGNVFVGGQIGSNAFNLTLRANGRYNVATSINSNGGFNSPPYANQPVIGGSGTGMTANYSSTGGYIDSLTIYNSGTGYRNGDVISVPGGIAGNSFVLQNYSPSRVGAFTGTALYTFGIDGNVTAPGNISISSNSSYFIGNTLGTTATYTGNVTAGNLITTGNISGANYITANVILTNGGWGNISNVAFLTANTITTTGNVTVGGNLTITGTKSNVPVKTGGFVAQNTAVSIDSITAQWLNTGAASANQLSLAALNGNVSILYTYTFQDGTGGSTTGGSSSTTLANLSFGWTSIGNPSGVAGDMYNVLVTLPGTNAYRITAMTGSGYSNNVLTIERLV